MSLFSNVTKTLAFSLILVNTVDAAALFPRGCEVSGFGYERDQVILNDSGQQSYYLVQNRTENKIELEREDSSEVFMSPPLQASLEPMNWAAFASDVKNVAFKCYQHNNEVTSLVNCEDVLDICQYPRVRFALSNMGNYWISINKSQQDVIQESVAKGIYLKW